MVMEQELVGGERVLVNYAEELIKHVAGNDTKKRKPQKR
jgi:hypothetical protein